MKSISFLSCTLLFCSYIFAEQSKPIAPVIVDAIAKTDDVTSNGDAADDSAIYVAPIPSKSLILGTNKKVGLGVYDLAGKKLTEFADGEQNNVDLRADFPLGNEKITLIGAGNRTTNTMDFYAIKPNSQTVERLSVKSLPAGLEVYGSCFYQSPVSKKFYYFVNSKNGDVIQWEIIGTTPLTAKKVRNFNVGSQVEGCVADDSRQQFYIGEEKVGIWRYSAEPNRGSSRVLIDSTGPGGHLVADVEGIALYPVGKKDGYIIASSQGSNSFTIYQRESGEYVGQFSVRYEGKLVMDCDGIAISSSYLNLTYPAGIVVVQDGNPLNPKQSFKFVPWHKIALSFSPPLKINPLSP